MANSCLIIFIVIFNSRGTARAILAKRMVIPGDGWNYDSTLGKSCIPLSCLKWIHQGRLVMCLTYINSGAFGHGAHRWNFGNNFLFSFLSFLKYQKPICEFLEQFFWNTTNYNFATHFIGPTYPWSVLWVRVSLTEGGFADLTDVTLADEDTKSIQTDDANRAIQGKCDNASDATWWPNL